MPEPFLVDANFFIQAHRFYYPMDVVPGFWNKVQELAEGGYIISIDKVGSEIIVGKDTLATWCNTHLPKNFFCDTSSVINEYAQVSAWAYSRSSHYTTAALAEFLDVNEADAWLVAYANANGNILVTHEVSDLNSKKRIKIPDAGYSPVTCVNTIEMFRRLGQSF